MRFPLVLLLALFVGGSASGSPPQNLNLDTGFSFQQKTSWVEQQDDWPQGSDDVAILRPADLACDVWAVDDHADWRAFGNLDAGASSSRTDCVVSDFSPVFATRFGTTGWWSTAPHGFAGILVKSTSPDLLVSVCYQPQGRCFTAGPVWDPVFGSYTYSFCGRADYRYDDPELVEVPNSNGGRGVFTDVTYTVSNPTGRRVRNVRVDGGFSSDFFFPDGCAGPQQANSEYPFAWTAS